MSYGVDCRCCLGPVLLWHRLAAADPIGPLGTSICCRYGPKKQKRKKKSKERKRERKGSKQASKQTSKRKEKRKEKKG